MGHFQCYLHISLCNLKREGNTQTIFLSRTLQLWSVHVLQHMLLSIMAAASFWDGHSDFPSVGRDVQV